MSNELHKFVLLPKRAGAPLDVPSHYASMLSQVIENRELYVTLEVRNEIINLMGQILRLPSVSSDNVGNRINDLIGILTPEVRNVDIADAILEIWHAATNISYQILVNNAGIINFHIVTDEEDNDDTSVYMMPDIQYSTNNVKQLFPELNFTCSKQCNDDLSIIPSFDFSEFNKVPIAGENDLTLKEFIYFGVLISLLTL